MNSLKIQMKHVLICGDFNLTLNPSLDCYNYINIINPQSRSTVLNAMSSHQLTDEFRYFHPGHYGKVKGQTRLGQLGANISPDRSSLTPQVLIGNFLKHNYPLLYELQHINLLCLYLPKKMVYPQTPNT